MSGFRDGLRGRQRTPFRAVCWPHGGDLDAGLPRSVMRSLRAVSEVPRPRSCHRVACTRGHSDTALRFLEQSQISSAESFANTSIVSASSVLSQIIRSRWVALSYLLGRPRPRRLNESRDSGYGLAVRRFERELLREESDAVTGGFGADACGAS